MDRAVVSIFAASICIFGNINGAELECCHIKIVGEYSYTLVNSSLPVPSRCLDGCVYLRDDIITGPYCFATGNEPVRCKDEDGYCPYSAPTVPGTTVPGCPSAQMVVKRNVKTLSGDNTNYLNKAMKTLKEYSDSNGKSFKNIANYHGKPWMCNAGQTEVEFPFTSTGWRTCCINHQNISGWDEMFTPWHRLFLLQMQLALNAAGNGNTGIPYWDWTTNASIPAFADQGEWKDGPDKWTKNTTTRGYNSSYITAKELAAMVKTAYKTDSITPFNYYINKPHQDVHNMVGGGMQNVPTAAYDPIFYLHHSEVDYQYAFWQELQRLRKKPVKFSLKNSLWKMQPFPTDIRNKFSNPFQITFNNPTPPDGLDYKDKFCYKYDQLLFLGQTPQEFLNNTSEEHKKPSLYAGHSDKYYGITSSQYFNLSRGSKVISEYIGPISSFGGRTQAYIKTNGDDLNEYLYDVTNRIEDGKPDPLDKTLHFEISIYEDQDGNTLPIENTYKPTVTYRKADTNHYVMRLHVEHIEKYSPVIVHCHIHSSVEFLTSNGSYSDQVTLESGVNITGEYPITKLRNTFLVSDTSITIGYQPSCHLQCDNDGLPTTGDPDIVVIPWNLNWLKCHHNLKEIPSQPDASVIIAWCSGQETDIVEVTNKKDFDDCTNLGYDPITQGSPEGYYVDGIILTQHTEDSVGSYYYASKSLCKFGFKIDIVITAA